jgi:solute carrier family 13 (sodium-dependent dicarboxylate transporter), member 2/3/5
MANRVERWRTLHLLGGPLAFLLLLLLPAESMAYPVRASLGLLLWMSWWWIFEPVGLAVTGFLPLVVLAVFNFLPVATILPSYSQELIFLLLGANILSTAWTRWGLDRRIALVSLMGVGTGTRRQIIVWFTIATVLSAFLPNTVVAAAMIPIVLAMLRFIGIGEIGRSAFGSALLIAIAWGTSVGGFWTPLGGAPNLLTIRLLQESVIPHEFLFMTWVTRLLPFSVALATVSLVFMMFAFKPELEQVEGSRDYFAGELRALGRLTVPERWGLALFLGATVFAFTRQFYAWLLPAFNPAYVFLAFALLCFVIRHKGEPLLTWDYAQAHMAWGLFYLFAGGAALGEILSATGTAKSVADMLVPLAGTGGLRAVLVFSLMTVLITQITNNTAAIAIMVPITIGTFQSVGANPIPWAYIVAVAGNCGLMLPSSAGGPAVAAGYGVNLKTMFSRGLWLTALLWLVIVCVGYVLVTYWPEFGVA